MNPILYLLYYFFKALIRLSTWFYYSKITVAGQRHHRRRNPCILVSNHPSTLLDPLNVAVEVQDEIFFLANASLFKHPVAAWLLSRLYCIPIERQQDTAGKPLNNAAAFEQSSQFLSKGGCLYVAPEGSSFVERRLRKIKTGTARIAFAAESANDFKLGLTILPVGLNYTDPTRFRSQLLTLFGDPIKVADFRGEYEADPVEAVRSLTEAIAQGLAPLLIDCEDEPQDRLLRQLETQLQNDRPLPALESLHRSQALLARLRRWKADQPADYEAFSALVFSYAEKARLLRISDRTVSKPESLGFSLGIVLGFPGMLVGYLSHWMPAFFTKKITDAINGDFHWIPTYKFAAGILIYPFFLWLQTWLVGILAESCGLGNWVKWAYLLSIVPLGLVAEWWLKKWRYRQESRRALSTIQNKKETWAELLALRLKTQQALAHLT